MIASEAAARGWLEQLPGFTADAAERLELLVAMLRDENLRQNLVSAQSLGSVWQRHIADSLQLLTHVPHDTASPWLDLGSGAGFPGLPVAILEPGIEVVLVEARPRRAQWLERLRSALELPQVRVVASRLELVPSFAAATISARAFAPLDKLLALSARFSTVDTTWLLPKGRSAQQELQKLSGWNHMFHVEQSLTDSDAGIVVGNLLGRKGRRS